MTIAPLIRRYGIDRLTEAGELEYAEGKALLAMGALEKIRRIRKIGYIDEEEARTLSEKYETSLREAEELAKGLKERMGDRYGTLVRRVATLHALGIERYWLRHLYKYNEIPEPVFKVVMKRLSAQVRRVERGELQIDKTRGRPSRTDIFERAGEYLVDRLEPKIPEVKARYLEVRTIHVITEKALEELVGLGKIPFVGESPEFREVVELYVGFLKEAEKERRSMFR